MFFRNFCLKSIVIIVLYPLICMELNLLYFYLFCFRTRFPNVAQASLELVLLVQSSHFGVPLLPHCQLVCMNGLYVQVWVCMGVHVHMYAHTHLCICAGPRLIVDILLDFYLIH